MLKKGLESALLGMRKEQGETRRLITGWGGKQRGESSRIIAAGKEPLASLTSSLPTLCFFAHAWTNERTLPQCIGGITFLYHIYASERICSEDLRDVNGRLQRLTAV